MMVSKCSHHFLGDINIPYSILAIGNSTLGYAAVRVTLGLALRLKLGEKRLLLNSKARNAHRLKNIDGISAKINVSIYSVTCCVI